jgi:hypothetical protein
MSFYVIGNQFTESIDGARMITQSEGLAKGSLPNQVTKIAVNGGPGSGKGSFEAAAISQLQQHYRDTVFILVAESDRDVITEKMKKGSQKSINQMIEEEAKRREKIAEELEKSFSGKDVVVIYDRDESNPYLYDLFMACYDNERLEEDSFKSELKTNAAFCSLSQKMVEKYDLAFCLKPVNHEINYACARPKVAGAKIDRIRSESYEMAKELQKAYEIASETIYQAKLRILPNTDTPDIHNASKTIAERAALGVKVMAEIIDGKKK